jgi:hypothetical protein
VAGNEHHRAFGLQRRIERTDRVGVTGTTGHHGDAGLAGHAAPGVGHVHGGGLVAHMHDVELRFDGGIVDRHDVVAREGEHGLVAEPFEAACNDVGAPELPRHVVSPGVWLRAKMAGKRVGVQT